jgi:hypothetical protein
LAGDIGIGADQLRAPRQQTDCLTDAVVIIVSALTDDNIIGFILLIVIPASCRALNSPGSPIT